jgi:hypothetical protein
MTDDVAPGILLEDEQQSIAKGLTPKTEGILSKTSLSQAFDVEVCASSFLSIEETGELKTAFYSIVRDERRAVRTFWRKTQSDDLIAHLLEMRKISRSLNAIVFNSVDKFIGAVRCVRRSSVDLVS